LADCFLDSVSKDLELPNNSPLLAESWNGDLVSKKL